MDLERLKSMVVEAKERSGGGNNLIWKPAEGLNTIRAVPYIYDPDMPFVELRVHYNEVSKKPIISPSTPSIGKPDPILEFGLRLQEHSQGDKETWIRGKRLEPKSRYYLPILIRGKEDEGIKFWGFGVNIFNMLFAKITNPKWGDFTDPINGRDIDVTYNKPTPANKYGETIIDVSPEKTPVTNDRAVLELMKEMPRVESLFKVYTYDEMERILADYIAKGTAEIPDDRDDLDDDDSGVSDAVNSGYRSVAAETNAPQPTNAADAELKNAFNDLFKKKAE